MMLPLGFVRRLLFVAAASIFLFAPDILFSQGSTTKWKGDSSSSWRTAANWDGGVPSSSKDVIISKSNPITDFDAHVPVPVGSDTAQTQALTMQQLGVLRFDSAGVLIVNGSDKILNQGTVYLQYGILITKSTMSFQNGGTFHAGSGTIRFSGSTWEHKAGSSFTPGTSTIIFEDTGSKSIIVDTSLTNFSFYTFQLLTQGTVSIQGNVTIENCYLAAGCTLNVPLGSSLTVNGSFTGDGVITGGGSYTPLPVQLISFQATAIGNEALLRWSTAAELNNYGFDVERRRVGEESETWMRIAFIAGGGTTTSSRSYEFVDRALRPGRYAYRIRQIDFDGTNALYGAAEIEVSGVPTELMLSTNYPNPFNPSTTLEFSVPSDGRVVLSVFNTIGERVATLVDEIAYTGTIYQATFSGDRFPTGLYFALMEFGNSRMIRKMVLVK